MGLYELTKCVFGFFGPICIIMYSYSAILYTVQCKLIGSKDGKSRATKLAATIVATFVVWYVVPYQYNSNLTDFLYVYVTCVNFIMLESRILKLTHVTYRVILELYQYGISIKTEQNGAPLPQRNIVLFSWVPFQALTLQSALGGFLEFGMSMTEKQEYIHKKIMPYAISLGKRD